MDRSAEMTSDDVYASRQRCFDLDQAGRALVLVRRIVADIVADYPRMIEMQEILELEQRYGSVEYIQQVQEEMAAVAERLRGYIEELDAIGVEVRDFARGLVDFPARIGGRDVCFCWQFGEKDIRYWHEPEGGKAGRRHISELPVPVAEATR